MLKRSLSGQKQSDDEDGLYSYDETFIRRLILGAPNSLHIRPLRSSSGSRRKLRKKVRFDLGPDIILSWKLPPSSRQLALQSSMMATLGLGGLSQMHSLFP
jgi:hypothetical protein